MSLRSEILTIPQQKALTLLAEGSTILAAARRVGVHRNTVTNWRKHSGLFQKAWTILKEHQLAHWQQQVGTLASTRQKSEPAGHNPAQLCLVAPPLPEPKSPAAKPQYRPAPTPVLSFASTQISRTNPLSRPTTNNPAPFCTTNAQSPVPGVPLRLTQDLTPNHPSRNQRCPCGSGLKFKRCCLGKRAA